LVKNVTKPKNIFVQYENSDYGLWHK